MELHPSKSANRCTCCCLPILSNRSILLTMTPVISATSNHCLLQPWALLLSWFPYSFNLNTNHGDRRANRYLRTLSTYTNLHLLQYCLLVIVTYLSTTMHTYFVTYIDTTVNWHATMPSTMKQLISRRLLPYLPIYLLFTHNNNESLRAAKNARSSATS